MRNAASLEAKWLLADRRTGSEDDLGDELVGQAVVVVGIEVAVGARVQVVI